MEEWRTVCRQNYLKSLDHRSFFFKEAQKKQLQGKKQLDELRKIAHLPHKTECQLKGGNPNTEFFCTYSSF